MELHSRDLWSGSSALENIASLWWGLLWAAVLTHLENSSLEKVQEIKTWHLVHPDWIWLKNDGKKNP